ncbi:MAG: hypothetical protein JRF33_19890, partial [Deltaproteobacteria bacterium]|nr:hypothetical protein [Deltaproteobacteria bacterium]
EGSNTYTYDSSPEYGLGRLHIANSDAGQAFYQYKPRGQVARYEFINATTQNTYVLQYEYNDAAATKTITYPDGQPYHYEYFQNGSPKKLYQTGRVIAQRSVFIDPADGLETTELLLENGNMSRRTKRDDSGRLRSLLSETVSPQALIMERNLNYYSNGKIQQIIDVETPRTSNYGYDSLMRLSEWSDSQYQQFETYSFLNGSTPNPKLQSVVNNTTTLSFSYGDSDFPWAVTQIVDNGAQSTKTLSYDEDGIISSVNLDGYNTYHTYNAQGLVKQVRSGYVSRRKWHYDHDGAVATIERIYPLSPTDYVHELVGNLYENINTYFNGSLFFEVGYRYLFFGGQRIARTTAGTAFIQYYHADERGSVRYVTDGNGTVTANFDYKPYGDEFTSSGSSTFRFNDRRDDGYDQLRFPLRMLNKTTYHWTALDPKVLTQPSVLLSDGANPFVYCMYDPVNRDDPLGAWSRPLGDGIDFKQSGHPPVSSNWFDPVGVVGDYGSKEAEEKWKKAREESPEIDLLHKLLDADHRTWTIDLVDEGAPTVDGQRIVGVKNYIPPGKEKITPVVPQFIHEGGHILYTFLTTGKLERGPSENTTEGARAHNFGQVLVRRWINCGFMKSYGKRYDTPSHFYHDAMSIHKSFEDAMDSSNAPFPNMPLAQGMFTYGQW